ncbi:hypothetical protein K492DRAFT_209859 [Lichtheimia hyalospora FSU 10163]|nr:hypothetical protein K492DRAFT_209859 [Lichtheimia hyalospora FSU 10163]
MSALLAVSSLQSLLQTQASLPIDYEKQRFLLQVPLLGVQYIDFIIQMVVRALLLLKVQMEAAGTMFALLAISSSRFLSLTVDLRFLLGYQLLQQYQPTP